MTNWMDKVKDVIIGKPKVHTVPLQPNRKQKRVKQAQLRKQHAAAKRKKYEGRG